MDHATAGKTIVRGIELDLAYIFTHPAFWPGIEYRTSLMRADSDTATQDWGTPTA